MPTIAAATVDVGRTVLSTLSSNLSTANGTTAAQSDQTNVLVGIVVEIIIIVLISGNLLMIVTLVHYKPWSIADLLLFSLSLSDFINGAIPVHILNIVNSFCGQNAWSFELCSAFTWMTFSLRMISVLTITLISGERMLMLTRPLHHHSVITIEKARLAVAGIWAAAMFIALLPFIGAGTSGFKNGYCYYQLYNLGIAYGYVIEAIGIIQLVLVLACFIAIRLSSGEFIKRQSVMAAAHQTGGKDTQLKKQETAGIKQVKQLSKLMGIVVILYYISWLPYLLMNLVGLARGRSLSHTVEVIIGFFSLISAIINPVLYGKMSLRYWRGYQFIFRKIRSTCGGEEPDGQFFDGKRRGSQATAYSVQSYPAAKRGSLASINRVDEEHVNAAFVEDEQNQHHGLKYPSHPREEEEDDDDDSDGNDEPGKIMICPVEELSTRELKIAANDHENGENDDSDDNDEIQISICPFEESLHIGEADETSEADTKNSQQMQEKTANDAHEEDIAICPLSESIMAHFEDIQKLVSEEDSEDNGSNGSAKGEALTENSKEGVSDNINKLEFGGTKAIRGGNNSKTNKGFVEDEVKDNVSNSSDNDEDIGAEDNKSGSPSRGHFFVDDVVKLLKEDEELKSQINNKNSYELVPAVKEDAVKAPLVREIVKQKIIKVGSVVKGDKKDETNKGQGDSQEETERLQARMEKEESRSNKEKDEEDEDDEEETEEDEEEQEEDDDDEEEEEEEEEESESKSEHEQEGIKEEKKEETDEDSEHGDSNNTPKRRLSNLEMDGYSSKITCLKKDNSKRKYTRSVSDLLRKELGEI